MKLGVDMDRLHGKNFVVTGAMGLLGKQHVLAILSEGGRAALIDIDSTQMENFIQELPKNQSNNVLTIKCDISQENDVMRAARMISETFGAVHGLVNNAAINASVEKNLDRFERFETITYSSWKEEIDIGLWGSILCSRIFGLLMIEGGIKGSIVNISSDHGLIAPNQNLYKIDGLLDEEQPVKPVTYSVIKHGLIGLTRYLATYWSASGIRINTLCPGGVLNNQNDQFISRINSLIPLGRMANPNEYWGALIFLLSDESSYMTGSTLVVDGGRSVW
jgi:NAD(P)-dependent dehydrogenase (short-subunit alcohol dehydrogenase family)